MGGTKKTQLRGEEELARRIVQEALGKNVRQNDDGTEPSMYDLRIGPPDAPAIAIEVVGAVAPRYTATWNTVPAKGAWTLSLAGNWTVVISPGAAVRKLQRELEQVLRQLEARGITNTRVNYYLKRDDEELFDKLSSLSVEHAYCYESPGTGKVYFSMPGDGGAVDDVGATIPDWISRFLREPAQADVLSKLARSGAPERHAFVVATMAGAPWSVASYFTSDPMQAPDQAPDLPAPVTAVWIIHGFGTKGLHWDGSGWHLVSTRGQGIEGPPP